ncbi:hypothetical protein E2320_007011, partial [Naja naja]
EATEEDVDLPGDDDIHRLKTASGKYWQSTKTPQAQSCMGFKNAICQRCGKRGHLARKCRAILPDDRVQAKQGQSKGPPRKVPRLGEDCFTIQKDNCQFNPRVGQTNLSLKKKKFLAIKIEGQDCQMEVDTGSSLSLVSWSTIKRLVPKMAKKRLRPCSLTLRDYQGNKIPILHLTKVTVLFKQFEGRLPLIVVERALPSFPWIGLAISGINATTGQNADTLDTLEKEFASVFDNNL